MFTLVAGLVLGLSAVADDPARIVLSHRGRPVVATYRPVVAVEHRQLGSVAPGGRASTLRCVRTVSIAVDRHARRDDGLVAARRLPAAFVETTRPGWCAGTAAAGGGRDARVRTAVADAAAADRATLFADLDTAASAG